MHDTTIVHRDHSRTKKHELGDACAAGDLASGLDRHVITDFDVALEVYVAPDGAALADAHIFTNEGKLAHPAAFTDRHPVSQNGSGGDNRAQRHDGQLYPVNPSSRVVPIGLLSAASGDRHRRIMVVSSSPFPSRRMRRLRRTPALRRMVAQTRLGIDDLIAPLFVREDITEPQPIASLPGVVQHTRASLRKEVAELAALGVPGIIVFGVPSHKDEIGSGAFDPDGIVQVALRDLRDDLGDQMVLISDLCVDEYTSHGHCGIVDAHGNVDNDATLEIYARAAIAQADAGSHMVAPSGMMDGQVRAIRNALDGSGHHEIPILAYAAKYASALYGPFRDAVDVQIIGGGDRKGYQQDWRNVREALAEVQLDLDEGADMVMVKPAVTYLDVIAKVRALTDVPLAAYHVSGEYAMLKAAAANGWIDGTAIAFEQLTAVKRAGADVILTYLTREIAEAMQ
jgi:porphobilinogen synthase